MKGRGLGLHHPPPGRGCPWFHWSSSCWMGLGEGRVYCESGHAHRCFQNPAVHQDSRPTGRLHPSLQRQPRVAQVHLQPLTPGEAWREPEAAISPGAWDLLSRRNCKGREGRGQARSEQGRLPPSPAPEEGPLGQALPSSSCKHEPDPPALSCSNQETGRQHLCPLHQQKPDQRQATLSVEDRPRWPGPSPCSQGERQDRCGVSAVH